MQVYLCYVYSRFNGETVSNLECIFRDEQDAKQWCTEYDACGNERTEYVVMEVK